MSKLVEGDDDSKRSILFASKAIVIRSNIYFIVARCFKVGLDKREIEKECKLTERLVADLLKCRDNYFMFGNLMHTLDSLKDDVDFINNTLMVNYPAILNLL
jgi:hypothetical protein